MTSGRAILSVMLVILAAALGIAGTGLLYNAVADQQYRILPWGLLFLLCGLSYCGRALAQGHRGIRLRHSARRSITRRQV